MADRRGQFHGVADGGLVRTGRLLGPLLRRGSTLGLFAAAAAAVPAAALGSFLCGRTAGKQRRRGGLKTGAVCGVLYCVPLILAALIFGTVQGILLPVKAALCIGFAAAGGVSGVNSPEK